MSHVKHGPLKSVLFLNSNKTRNDNFVALKPKPKIGSIMVQNIVLLFFPLKSCRGVVMLRCDGVPVEFEFAPLPSRASCRSFTQRPSEFQKGIHQNYCALFCTVQMSGRPRNVGLTRPRAGAGEASQARGLRARANLDEADRVRNQDLQPFDDNLGLDNIPSGANEPEIPNAGRNSPPVNPDEGEPEVGGENSDEPARRRVAPWIGNTARLNIMARTLLLAPRNFEATAVSSQRQSELETVRNIKRIPASPLAWDNLKHAGKTILLNYVVSELNSDHSYLDSCGRAFINTELLRQKMNQFIMLSSVPVVHDANTEQWKVDLREIDEMQESQDEAVQREAAAGVGARSAIESAVGNLVHAPNVGGRSLQIDAIGDRVLSQSGRPVARRREEGVIPQDVQQPARAPAAIPSVAIVANIARNHPGNPASDDPFLQALLAMHGGAASGTSRPPFDQSPIRPVPDLKLMEEARSIQIQTQMKQYEFAEKFAVFQDEATKRQVLDGLRDQILGSAEPCCGICHAPVTGMVNGIARMGCCGGTLHTACLVKVIGKKCPFCRHLDLD
jgi:hypothetical protein